MAMTVGTEEVKLMWRRVFPLPHANTRARARSRWRRRRRRGEMISCDLRRLHESRALECEGAERRADYPPHIPISLRHSACARMCMKEVHDDNGCGGRQRPQPTNYAGGAHSTFGIMLSFFRAFAWKRGFLEYSNEQEEKTTNTFYNCCTVSQMVTY